MKISAFANGRIGGRSGMFGRRSDAAGVGAVDPGMKAGPAGGDEGVVCVGTAGFVADVVLAPAPWVAAALAATGFVTCDVLVAGWTALLSGVGLACLAGAAVFFATVACIALVGGFAAVR
jgi:hypothetical protein